MDNKRIISKAIYSAKKIWLHMTAGIIWSAVLIFLYQDFKKDSLDDYSHLFLNSAWIAENLIDYEISKINDAIGSSKRFFESSESVTKEEFMKFIGPMITENQNIISASWIPEIDIRNKELFERKALEYGLNDFILSEISSTGEYAPAKIRQKYYPVFYSEGLTPNQGKVGLDLGSRADLAKLIEKAISSGQTSSGSIFRMNEPQKIHGENGLNIFSPVYKTNKNSDENLSAKGLLYFIIKIEDIIKSAKIHADQEGLLFSFTEIDPQNDADNNSKSAHGTYSKRSYQSSSFYNSGELTHTHEVIFADKKYIFTFSSTSANVSSHMQKKFLLISLLGITGFLLFFFYIKSVLSGMHKKDEFEYRKAAENLRAKSLIRSIIDSIPQGICWKDVELTYLGCNYSFAVSANLESPDEILLMKNSEIELLFDISDSEQIEKNILLTGKPVLHEKVETCLPNGDSKWIDICRIPIIAEDNSITGILCIYDDITNAKTAEKELSRTRLLLEAAFDQNPAGMILITSGDNRVKLTNKSAFRFLGFNDEDAVDSLKKHDYVIELNKMLKTYDRNGSQLDTDDGTPLFRALHGEKIINEERRVIKKNGEVAWCIINGTPIYDEKGKVVAALVVFPDITSRKEMEDRLKINEEKYRALFEQSGMGVFLYNHQFEIIDCNEQFALTIGAPKERMIGLALRKLKDQRVMPVLEKAMLGEKAYYEGDYVTTTSGLCIRVSFVALPIMNSINEIAFGCAVVENITEKWLIQKALLEKNEELDKFFSNSLDLLCIAGFDGHFKRLNPQWTITLGYSMEHLIGKSFWDFVHPEDIVSTKEAVSKLVTSKKVVDFVNRYRCSDGSYKWIEWRSYPSGNTIYAAARDITARKNTEDEIRMREELFRTLSEMAPVGIFLANEIGEIILTNRKWIEITGVTAEETLGNGWIRYVYHDDAALINSVLDNSIRSICDTETVFRFVRPDGKMKNIMIKATPIIKEDGFLNGFVGTIEDITERKKNESEREHLLYEISQKNTELEGIVYAASHDLRAPLVNIQGFSIRIEKLTDELSRLIKIESDKEKCIEIIESKIPNATNYIKISASKMDTLIKGLLQVARIGRRPLISETIDMNVMIENILQTMAFQIQESGAKITCHKLPECKGDISQLNQAFSNIIDNALKYQNPEKKLEIIISGFRKEDKNIYTVEDTGIGISEGQKDKIWTMFYRLSPSGPVSGEGLGLTVVKKIIEMHGGKVWAEPGKDGSIFFIELKGAY